MVGDGGASLWTALPQINQELKNRIHTHTHSLKMKGGALLSLFASSYKGTEARGPGTSPGCWMAMMTQAGNLEALLCP